MKRMREESMDANGGGSGDSGEYVELRASKRQKVDDSEMMRALPPEVWSRILWFVPVDDVFRFCCASKTTKELVEESFPEWSSFKKIHGLVEGRREDFIDCFLGHLAKVRGMMMSPGFAMPEIFSNEEELTRMFAYMCETDSIRPCFLYGDANKYEMHHTLQSVMNLDFVPLFRYLVTSGLIDFVHHSNSVSERYGLPKLISGDDSSDGGRSSKEHQIVLADFKELLRNDIRYGVLHFLVEAQQLNAGVFPKLMYLSHEVGIFYPGFVERLLSKACVGIIPFLHERNTLTKEMMPGFELTSRCFHYAISYHTHSACLETFKYMHQNMGFAIDLDFGSGVLFVKEEHNREIELKRLLFSSYKLFPYSEMADIVVYALAENGVNVYRTLLEYVLTNEVSKFVIPAAVRGGYASTAEDLFSFELLPKTAFSSELQKEVHPVAKIHWEALSYIHLHMPWDVDTFESRLSESEVNDMIANNLECLRYMVLYMGVECPMDLSSIGIEFGKEDGFESSDITMEMERRLQEHLFVTIGQNEFMECIPSEILELVIEYLPPEDIYALRATSKRMRGCIDEFPFVQELSCDIALQDSECVRPSIMPMLLQISLLREISAAAKEKEEDEEDKTLRQKVIRYICTVSGELGGRCIAAPYSYVSKLPPLLPMAVEARNVYVLKCIHEALSDTQYSPVEHSKEYECALSCACSGAYTDAFDYLYALLRPFDTNPEDYNNYFRDGFVRSYTLKAYESQNAEFFEYFCSFLPDKPDFLGLCPDRLESPELYRADRMHELLTQADVMHRYVDFSIMLDKVPGLVMFHRGNLQMIKLICKPHDEGGFDIAWMYRSDPPEVFERFVILSILFTLLSGNTEAAEYVLETLYERIVPLDQMGTNALDMLFPKLYRAFCMSHMKEYAHVREMGEFILDRVSSSVAPTSCYIYRQWRDIAGIHSEILYAHACAFLNHEALLSVCKHFPPERHLVSIANGEGGLKYIFGRSVQPVLDRDDHRMLVDYIESMPTHKLDNHMLTVLKFLRERLGWKEDDLMHSMRVRSSRQSQISHGRCEQFYPLLLWDMVFRRDLVHSLRYLHEEYCVDFSNMIEPDPMNFGIPKQTMYSWLMDAILAYGQFHVFRYMHKNGIAPKWFVERMKSYNRATASAFLSTYSGRCTLSERERSGFGKLFVYILDNMCKEDGEEQGEDDDSGDDEECE